MLRPLVRSLVSAVVAACFYLGGVAGSGMSGCAPSQGHDHGATHGHPGQGGQSSGGTHCVVHLCCADMAPQPPVALGTVPMGAATRDAALGATAAVSTRRPAYSLPFAHAPPRSIV
jgi:hypothetical protein